MLLESFYIRRLRLSVKGKAFMYEWEPWFFFSLIYCSFRHFPQKFSGTAVGAEGQTVHHWWERRRSVWWAHHLFEKVRRTEHPPLFLFVVVSPIKLSALVRKNLFFSIIILNRQCGARKTSWWTAAFSTWNTEKYFFFRSSLLIKVLYPVICGNGNYWHALRNTSLKAGKNVFWFLPAVLCRLVDLLEGSSDLMYCAQDLIYSIKT